VPIDVVQGSTRNLGAARTLAEAVSAVANEGTIYLGYPVLATADERVDVDAMLVSSDHGVVAFLIGEELPASEEEWEDAIAEQDRLYGVLESHLGRHESLRAGRHLALTLNTATVFAADPGGAPHGTEAVFLPLEAVAGWVERLPPIEPGVSAAVQAALQRVTTIPRWNGKDLSRVAVRDRARSAVCIELFEERSDRGCPWETSSLKLKLSPGCSL
jgi:hypothetical protein